MADARPTPAALAQLFADVFETDTRGRTCLAHLEQVFAKPAVVEGGIDAVLKTFQRAGMRELLDYIHNQIERAHQSAEPTETPTLKTE